MTCSCQRAACVRRQAGHGMWLGCTAIMVGYSSTCLFRPSTSVITAPKHVLLRRQRMIELPP